MVEFLLLMFTLDKIYFTPLGDFMDQHDFTIKEKFADVKDTSSEVKQLEEQANAIMHAARPEISADFSEVAGSFGCQKGGSWADLSGGVRGWPDFKWWWRYEL